MRQTQKNWREYKALIRIIFIETPQTQMSTNLKYIDLFCGIGGFHLAMSSFGHQCILACDIDKDCMKVYEDNFDMKPFNDITSIDEKKLEDFDVLCGGFPCQAFSHSGKQKGFEDTRGTLFYDICRILEAKQPKYFILENVKNLKTHNKGNTWATIYQSLTDLGYETYQKPIILSPHHIGVPQNRERVFIVGVRKDLGCLSPFPVFEQKSCDAKSILQEDDEISTQVMEHVRMKSTDIEVINIWNEVVQHFAESQGKLPGFPLWTDDWDSIYDIEELPEWKQNFIKKNRDFYNCHKYFLESWLTMARENAAFTGAKRKLEWQAGALNTDSSIWNCIFQCRPSGIRVKTANYFPALVAMAQIPVVGELKRKLTPRETARLQSFPDTFRIHQSMSKAYKQFGNSVNVDVVREIIKHLICT
jgi:DNA (cytosine-5)-methyltransferase 1